jgi:murein tripeptide amidase MpaA
MSFGVGGSARCGGRDFVRRYRQEKLMFTRKMSPIAVVCAAMFSFTGHAHAGEGRDEAPQRFDDHQLIQVDLRTARDLRTMLEIGATPWACRVGLGEQPFSVSPEQLAIVEASRLEFDVLAENVQRLFDEEARQIAEARERAAAEDEWFAVYRNTDEVNTYMDGLVALKPDIIERFTVGTTIQGRTVYAWRITGPGDSSNRPAVLFNGAQHAREWISVMVPTYMADRFVKGYGTDPRITAVLNEVVVYIVPIVNPDGYEFSQTSGNRMWRKNRRNNPGSSCFGVDLNRNWDYGWGGPHSTSTNPCSDIFIGSGAHSEPEVANLAAFMLARPNIKAHVDIHNFSELVLHAWGDTNTPHPEAENIVNLAAMMSEAIYDVHGVWYPYGTPGQLLYSVSGSMQDWVTSTGAYGYTIEVRPASSNPGFLLPPEQILPTSQENFAAALVMAEFVAQGVVFSFPDGLPELVDAGGNTTVTVNASPVSSGDINHATATLYTRVGTGGFQPTPMTHLGGSLYEVNFPPKVCGSEVEFYFEVASVAGEYYQSPLGAPGTVFTATAANIVVQELLAESFDAGVPGGWSATGLWHVTTSCPVTGACEPQWAYYGQSSTCNYNTGGANAGVLTSAPVSIPDLEGGTATLSFCYNLVTENHSSYDIAEFSINGGPWQRMNEAANWTTYSEDVSAFSGRTSCSAGALTPSTARSTTSAVGRSPT